MKKIIYPALKEDDTDFRIINSKFFKAELNALKKGRYRVIVETYRKEKSHPQLQYLFGAVYPLSMQLLNDAGWEIGGIDEVDLFWKQMFAQKNIINRNTGEIRPIPALKRDFLTIDMMTYIDSIRNYCSEFLGGYIPGPEEKMKIEFDN